MFEIWIFILILVCIAVFASLIYGSIKDSRVSCTICKYQPNGYFWIDNKRYCEKCFETIRKCKLTEEEIQYKILMHIQESRKKTIDEIHQASSLDETKLITQDEWHWLKKGKK